MNAPGLHIEGRLLGTYDLGGGLGTRIDAEHPMTFHGGGRVNAPRRGHGLWFLAQMRRLGLRSAPAYGAIVESLVMRDLHEDVARAEDVPVPDDDMAPFTVGLDGADFDPAHPDREARRGEPLPVA